MLLLGRSGRFRFSRCAAEYSSNSQAAAPKNAKWPKILNSPMTSSVNQMPKTVTPIKVNIILVRLPVARFIILCFC